MLLNEGTHVRDLGVPLKSCVRWSLLVGWEEIDAGDLLIFDSRRLILHVHIICDEFDRFDLHLSKLLCELIEFDCH